MLCHKCGKDKPVDEFNYADKARGIRQSMCRACFSEYNRERYKRDSANVRKRVSEYRKNNPLACFDTRKKAFEKNPTKYNLRKLTEAAIKAGVLAKPEKCQICGMSPKKHIEAHHEDYSKPLDVVWCCTVCHDALDRDRRRLEGKPTHSRAVIVECVETGERFYSIADAAKHEGVKAQSLRYCTLNGKALNGKHYTRV